MRRLCGIGRIGLALAAACVLLCASPAPAGQGDDAGLRSVFAHGAGNRALAMGGAQVADLHGPSALIWNPGALALLDRYRFEASNTDLIGLGFNEKYFGLAVPSWRFGVTALSLRTFGVDGIEHRDDRNILLADDLKDVQSEIMLGWGTACIHLCRWASRRSCGTMSWPATRTWAWVSTSACTSGPSR